MRALFVSTHELPLAGEFRITHGTLHSVHVVRVEIHEQGHIGRGECRPYARYGETPETVTQQIESTRNKIEHGMNVHDLQGALEAGAARNAVDCALWDLRAKQSRQPMSDLLNLPKPQRRKTAYTLSIDTPENMAKAARASTEFDILKVKVNGAMTIPSCQAIIDARPDAKLIVDANEGLNVETLKQFVSSVGEASIALIEQPLPAKAVTPDTFKGISGVPICADESIHTSADLVHIRDAGYTAVNIKLDKCGGLTDALNLAKQARDMGFIIMGGCMVASSLAIAPMMYLESFFDFIDLDGPILLKTDIENGLEYDGQWIHGPHHTLWG